MKPQSIHNQIEEKIKSLKKGNILFITDFIEFGTAENVKKVLLRLEKKRSFNSISTRYLSISKKR